MKPYKAVLSDLVSAYEEHCDDYVEDLDLNQRVVRAVHGIHFDFEEYHEDDDEIRRFWLEVSRWAEDIAYSVGACR